MTSHLGSWMTKYGAFLVVMGVVGYLSNPEKAATALLSGGTFGTLSIAWGAFLRRGREWARWGAFATVAMLATIAASRRATRRG